MSTTESKLFGLNGKKIEIFTMPEQMKGRWSQVLVRQISAKDGLEEFVAVHAFIPYDFDPTYINGQFSTGKFTVEPADRKINDFITPEEQEKLMSEYIKDQEEAPKKTNLIDINTPPKLNILK